MTAQPMDSLTCAMCQRVELEYVGVTSCAACAGLSVLKTSEAKTWIASERARLMTAANELLSDRRPRTVAPVLRNLERLMIQSVGAGVNINFAALSAVDGLREVLALTPSVRNYAPNAATAAAASIMAYDLGVLNVLPFQVAQGEMDVVHGLARESRTRPSMLEPNFPLVRRDREWTRWTQVAYNRGPDLHTEPDHMRALTLDDPDASIPALAARALTIAGRRSVSVLPIISSIDRQTFKAFAPGLASLLNRMPSSDIDRLQAMLDAFANYADGTVGRDGSGLIEVQIRELIRRLQGYTDIGVLANLSINQQPGKTIPLAVRQGTSVVFPAELSRNLRMIVLNYRRNLGADLAMSDLSSDAFEQVISRVLRRCGYETISDGRELISVATHKGGLNEIDVVAWDPREILLVEAKFEIDPPGGWTTGMIKKRQDELDTHVKQHLPKGAAWESHLRQHRPSGRFHPGDEVVNLPDNLLSTRTIRLLIVSGRVEPAIDSPVEVVTFMPQKAAALAARKLPTQQLSRIWDGTNPP